MTKDQIRERALIDAIIRSANSHFWYHLGRLLSLPVPVTYAEKLKFVKKIKGHMNVTRPNLPRKDTLNKWI